MQVFHLFSFWDAFEQKKSLDGKCLYTRFMYTEYCEFHNNNAMFRGSGL